MIPTVPGIQPKGKNVEIEYGPEGMKLHNINARRKAPNMR